MDLLSGSVLNIQIPSQVADEVNVDIQKNALVNIRNGAEFNLDSKDKWSGMINNGGGTLTTSQLTNSTGSGGGLQQTAGTSILKIILIFQLLMLTATLEAAMFKFLIIPAYTLEPELQN